ncbi:MAG: hypothetical protein PHD32_04735 [Eubacteriales bacterium]|nr:hypothetical protein [Eubacteriales bacterium]
MPVWNQFSVTATAATVTTLMGVQAPHGAAQPLSPVLALAQRAFHGRTADRVLLYNPDAVALWLFQKYTAAFEPVLSRTQLGLPLKTVMPSVTPVCFASMYTGVLPEAHGIRTYEKPVLKADTVFDALLRAGKRPAIVSTAGDSISCIFQERAMDYFLFPTPQECTRKALELIERDEHDLIVLYNGEYDATMHKVSPEGEAALAKLSQNAQEFAQMADAVQAHWGEHDALAFFAPDHGCHEIDGEMGSHGLEMPEDLNIMHFYGAFPRQEK